jgi:hypothetical protein
MMKVIFIHNVQIFFKSDQIINDCDKRFKIQSIFFLFNSLKVKTNVTYFISSIIFKQPFEFISKKFSFLSVCSVCSMKSIKLTGISLKSPRHISFTFILKLFNYICFFFHFFLTTFFNLPKKLLQYKFCKMAEEINVTRLIISIILTINSLISVIPTSIFLLFFKKSFDKFYTSKDEYKTTLKYITKRQTYYMGLMTLTYQIICIIFQITRISEFTIFMEEAKLPIALIQFLFLMLLFFFLILYSLWSLGISISVQFRILSKFYIKEYNTNYMHITFQIVSIVIPLVFCLTYTAFYVL